MTPEELLAQLRDIHLPADAPQAPPAGFAIWPIAVFLAIFAGVLAVRYWKRHAWRWQARAALREIGKEQDFERRWSKLASLAEHVARMSAKTTALPAAAYRHPSNLTEDDAGSLSAYVYRETKA